MTESTPAAKNPNRKYSYILMGGHMMADINQGAISAILPFLVMYDGFTYTQVAMVVLGLNILSAIAQPVFGIIGDKRGVPWLMALGCFLAGLGMFCVGRFTSLPAIVASAMVSGFGVAMFHPEGGRLANIVAGAKKGRGMSIFAVGGNIGFAVGPVLVAIFVGAFGLGGTIVFLIPCTLYALFLLSLNKTFKSFGLVDKNVSAKSGVRERPGLFTLILAALSVRSIIFSGSLAFIPLFMVNTLGQPEAIGSLMITLYSVVGVCATLASGPLSEKVDTAKLLAACLAFVAVLFVVFVQVPVLPVLVVVVVLLAAANNLSYAPAVARGQSYLPNHLGTAAGMLYGVVTAVGGIASPGLGTIGDNFGLTYIFLIMALAAIVACILALIVVYADRKAAASE